MSEAPGSADSRRAAVYRYRIETFGEVAESLPALAQMLGVKVADIVAWEEGRVPVPDAIMQRLQVQPGTDG